ncbi:hypothetical protein AB0J21_25310 [Streptomyces sp. NPDC049954]|uniref:hypothetical protein n=1 Tax=Streptomyces sp. NPDC049954 TaxID=3155779 RepID=UPI003416C3CD
MALAAMPTAVFVGIGLTPRLALADDKAELPFAPGPCVTRSDEPAGEDPSATPSPSASPSGSASPSPDAGGTPKPSATPDAPAKGSDGAKGDAKDPDTKDSGTSAATGAQDSGQSAGPEAKSAPEPSSTPSPSASETTNPLDPLGVGKALKDLLTPKEKKEQEEKEAADKAAAEKAAQDEAQDEAESAGSGAEPGATASPDAPAGKAGKAKAPESGAKDAASASPRTLKDDITDAARKAGAAEKDIVEGARSAAEKNAAGPRAEKDGEDGAKAGDLKLDGTEPYPCPTHDAKALADADVDESYPRVADEPWRLETTKLSLHGLGYDGIVKVRTSSGRIKNVLKFTASGLDIKDLHQLTVGPDGKTGHVKGAPGSTSTIRDGKVTMYTERLKGNLLGLIPVDFTPDSPPPLTLPELFFTKVTVVQAAQFGGTLTIPGLHNYYDGDAG